MFGEPLEWITVIQFVIFWILLAILVVIFFVGMIILREAKSPKMPVQDENTLAKVYEGLSEAGLEMPGAALVVSSIMEKGIGFYNRDPLNSEEEK